MQPDWAAFASSADGFGEFVSGPAEEEHVSHALLRDVFGHFGATEARPQGLEAAFPAEWSAPSAGKRAGVPMKVAEERLMAAVGLRAPPAALPEGARALTIVAGMQARRVAWRDEEDLTAADLCERAGVSVTEVVLVAAGDQFVPMSQQASALPGGVLSLTAEPRLRYLLRRMPQLLENVAAAERGHAVTLFERDARLALVSETTRLDGVRYVPGALLEAGDLRGVAVFRKLVMLGVCKLAMLIQVLSCFGWLSSDCF